MPQQQIIERTALTLTFIVAGTVLSQQVLESRWKKFTSREGACTILMPGKPKAENETRVIVGMKMETINSQLGVELVRSSALPTWMYRWSHLSRQVKGCWMRSAKS